MSLSDYIIGAAIVALVACAAWPFVKFAWKSLRGQGVAFALIVAGFLASMATKPNVTWDSYLRDNGTVYTNSNTAVDFRWTKRVATIPNTATVTISQKPNGGSTWTDVASSTIGEGYYRLSIASTNYVWYVWTDYVPPVPVHTNGVWLGTVLEKPKNDTGLGKLIIVNGQLIQNGKVIAPCAK